MTDYKKLIYDAVIGYDIELVKKLTRRSFEPGRRSN